tara:strand:+ start:52 stop:546 length:495 start_codon:yes stop_codon:yes gene_type:complete
MNMEISNVHMEHVRARLENNRILREKEQVLREQRELEEIKEAEQRQKADQSDYAKIVAYQNGMYMCFASIMIRTLTNNQRNGFSFANTGTLTRMCGNTPEGTFSNTNSDLFLKRMNKEGVLECITKSSMKSSGKPLNHHYYYIKAITHGDVENLEEAEIKKALI